MLTEQTRALVKASVPALQAHGLALTQRFYERLFLAHPALKEMFNQRHQQDDSQSQALAGAVLAYAQHIDRPEVLAGALTHIAHKHVSLGIRAEHYPLVGQQLLGAMGDVLGEAATPELVAAWGQAYGWLAQQLIQAESALYQASASQPGGWSGARSLRVRRKQVMSDTICRFELVPVDGGPLPGYKPGQYVSINFRSQPGGLAQWRQYSLVGAPGGDALEIAVKREGGDEGASGCPLGHVSASLHDRVKEGDILAVSAPAGDFSLHEDRDTPVVLLSAGVGITPMMAMLRQLAAQGSGRELHFWHACQSPSHLAFQEEVISAFQRLPQAQLRVAFESQAPAAPWAQAGRLDAAQLPAHLAGVADAYLCGPRGFMQAQRERLLAAGWPGDRIHQETFGSGSA